MFFEFLRVAEYIKPKVIVGENVAGLTMGEAKEYYNKITNTFDTEILGELPISKDLIKRHDSEHPIVKQKQSDIIFKSFFDICQKVLSKIKV